MTCPRCQAHNRDGARFCRECGSTFAAVCAACGAKLEAGGKFCDSCGAPLTAAPAPPAAPPRLASPESYTPKHLAERSLTSKAGLEGERKQVTVLFADLTERQRRGGQAQFTDPATDTTVHVPAHRHTVAEYVNGWIAAGLSLRHLGEWVEAGAPRDVPPRLLSVLFESVRN